MSCRKLVHCVQCQGHSEGLLNQNMTISVVSTTAGLFATRLGLIVQHYKWECRVEKWDYCIQGQLTAKVQNVCECLSG